MYKALYDSIAHSEKLADLSDYAFRLWTCGLAVSDTLGRLTVNPRVLHAKATPMSPYEEPKILAALNEIKAQGLAHFYEVSGKPYMVFHDHEQHNKSHKNLQNIKPEYPAPPQGLCLCVCFTKAEEDSPRSGEKVPPIGVPVLVPVHVQVPVQEVDSKGEGSTARTLAAVWNKGPGEHLNGNKAMEKVQAAIDVGVNPQAIEQAFWNYQQVKGRKIWEVLDPLRPIQANGVGSIQDIMNDWVKERQK